MLSVRLLDCIRNGPIQLSGSLSIPKMMRDGSRDCWFPDGWDEMNIITIDRDLLLAVPTHTINLALGCFTIITSSIGIGWCLQSIGKYTHIDGVSILFENWILTKLCASYRIYTFNCRHKVRRYIYIETDRRHPNCTNKSTKDANTWFLCQPYIHIDFIQCHWTIDAARIYLENNQQPLRLSRHTII